jgi:hypothetical protein
MSSWPALFAAAVAMWLILKGPVVKKPSWVQKTCRLAMAFFLYSGFLYLLKWNPFWRWMSSVDFENRNKAEGFLILISTLVWIIATLRILLLGSRFPALDAGSDELENRAPRQEKLWPFIKNVAIFHYFFTRR